MELNIDHRILCVLLILFNADASPTSSTRHSYVAALETVSQNNMHRNGHARPTVTSAIHPPTTKSHWPLSGLSNPSLHDEFPDYRSLSSFPEVMEVDQHIQPLKAGVSDFEDAEFLLRSLSPEAVEPDNIMELSESRYVQPKIQYPQFFKTVSPRPRQYNNIVRFKGKMLDDLDRSRYPILYEWLKDVSPKPNLKFSSSAEVTHLDTMVTEEPKLEPANVTRLFEELGSDSKRVWGPSPACQATGKRFCTIEEDPAVETLAFLSREFAEVLRNFSSQSVSNMSSGPISDIYDEGKTCKTEIENIRPTWFIDDVTNLWVIALQTKEIQQFIRREYCRTPYLPCQYVIPYYQSSCLPNIVLHPVLSWSPTQPTQIQTSSFKTEGGCICHIRTPDSVNY